MRTCAMDRARDRIRWSKHVRSPCFERSEPYIKNRSREVDAESRDEGGEQDAVWTAQESDNFLTNCWCVDERDHLGKIIRDQ